MVNLGFGDLKPDGSIDDKVNSNNGDIVRVLATVIEILLDFTCNNPDVEIFFAGSTQQRTKLYTRILKMYYGKFSKQFEIKAIVTEGDRYTVLPFEPRADLNFVGFIIRKNY